MLTSSGSAEGTGALEQGNQDDQHDHSFEIGKVISGKQLSIRPKLALQSIEGEKGVRGREVPELVVGPFVEFDAEPFFGMPSATSRSFSLLTSSYVVLNCCT